MPQKIIFHSSKYWFFWLIIIFLIIFSIKITPRFRICITIFLIIWIFCQIIIRFSCLSFDNKIFIIFFALIFDIILFLFLLDIFCEFLKLFFRIFLNELCLSQIRKIIKFSDLFFEFIPELIRVHIKYFIKM